MWMSRVKSNKYLCAELKVDVPCPVQKFLPPSLLHLVRKKILSPGMIDSLFDTEGSCEYIE
jgi:hypothetical protein